MSANPRTIRKAMIKRGSAAARRQIGVLDVRIAGELTSIYRTARDDLERQIREYAASDQTLRLEVLRELSTQVDRRIDQLGAERDRLLFSGIDDAARIGVRPFQPDAATLRVGLAQVSHDAVEFVRNFVAEDGLQLSDRLWRLDRGAKETVGRAIESSIIQGHSASQAAQDFLARGVPVPADVAQKAGMAGADRVSRIAGRALMVDDDNAYENALRVFRTEINRAHGEAYERAAESHPEAVGVRFLLSPLHPRPDICDMHASANLYGLGPGVYPFGKSPWPAHPNTLSFEEVVFADEVSQSDRDGKEDRIDWLKKQKGDIQVGVLDSTKKRAALQRGILKENEIATPWRVLKQRYERRGIDVDAL